MRHKTITLGKNSLRSVMLQVTTILQALHGDGIRIVQIKPKWTKTGNIAVVKFRSVDSPQPFRAVFRMERIGACLDLWMDASKATQTFADGGVS